MDPSGLANVLVPIAGMATGVVLLMTVGRLIRHWVDRHYDGSGGGVALSNEIAELRNEVTRTRELEERVLELEDRVDFAERMLARDREPAQLEPRADA